MEESMTFWIRKALPTDAPALVSLSAEHARHERVEYHLDGKEESIRKALSGTMPILHAWVAEDEHGIAGYATATMDFSTWSCRWYMHMDCLFVRERMRGNGIGAGLVRGVVASARERGIEELQWQTPQWNRDAIRFYLRMGAASSEKRRFTLPVQPQ
jgi:GNAT superfamily N-acetyltransferase